MIASLIVRYVFAFFLAWWVHGLRSKADELATVALIAVDALCACCQAVRNGLRLTLVAVIPLGRTGNCILASE